MEASEDEWVNSVLYIIKVNSLKLEDLRIRSTLKKDPLVFIYFYHGFAKIWYQIQTVFLFDVFCLYLQKNLPVSVYELEYFEIFQYGGLRVDVS